MIFVDRIFRSLCLPIQKNALFFVFMYLLGVICIFVDPSVNKSITFLELFFDIYILCVLLSFLSNKTRSLICGIVSFVLYLIAIIDVYLIVRLGASITPTFVQMVLETDQSEAMEALSSYVTVNNILSPVSFVLLLAITHFVILLRKGYTAFNSFHRIVSTIVFILLITSIIVSIRPKKFMTMMYLGNHETFINLQGMGYYKPDRIYYLPIYKLLYSLKENTFGKEEIEELIKGLEEVRVDTCSFDSPNIILVIGESHNKHHSHIYGYNKETTPFQDEEMNKGRLVVYSDVITSYNATTESFKNMFSLYAYGELHNWSSYPLFPVIFRKAGYHTAFITNQFTQDLNANFSDFDVGMFFNNKIISKAQFDVRNLNRHVYDQDLLHDYDSLKQYNGTNNLLVFHLRGQHVKYDQRFPQKWYIFKSTDYNRPDLTESDLQVLAAYDNATLYNDFVLKEIIKRFEDIDAVVIYLSDHGEVVFDGCQSFGRPMIFDANNLFQQFQIPFWIYMTDRYQNLHREMADMIRKAKDRPFMTDNIAQLLLHLAGIKTESYNTFADPLSNHYNESRKRMIRGKYDYDIIMKDYSVVVDN